VIEPYAFVRGVTLALGLLWSTAALVRLARASRQWRARLADLGVEPRQWRRWIAHVALRTVVLDPLNLALICLLAALWSWPLGG
jgi:hypothetical protein